MEKTYYSSVKHNTGQTPRVANIYSYVKKLLVLMAVLIVGGTEAWGTVTYHIINMGKLDNNGNLTNSRTEALRFTSNETTIGLPAAYQSPLATGWKYYNAGDVTFNTSTKVCTFNDADNPSLNAGDPVGDNTDIYVTYEFNKAALSTVGITDGGICNIKFSNESYLYQSDWRGDPNTASEPSSTATTDSKYLWKINVKDPYQITIQSKSNNVVSGSKLTDYFLTANNGAFGDVRLRKTLELAKNNKVWAFGLLPGSAANTYRLVVADGYINSPTNDNQVDAFGHGYLNNADADKTRYQKYGKEAHNKCDLTFEAITKPYTYHILNFTGNEAIQYTTPSAVPAGTALTGYASIPADIRTPYISDGTIRFYSSNTISDENEIYELPALTTDVYVTYTTNLASKFLHLRGARALNLTVNGDYISDSGTAGSGTLAHKPTPTDAEKESTEYLWFISGEDPYALQIRNAKTGNYFKYTTPSTLELASAPAQDAPLATKALFNFILMAGTANDEGDPRTYEQMELMAATGSTTYYHVGRTDDAFSISTTAGTAAQQVIAYPSSSTNTYHLIDRAGKLIESISSTSDELSLPDEWKSPLVSEYHYWLPNAFNVAGETYTLKDGVDANNDGDYEDEGDTPAPKEIKNTTDASGEIYVTYTVSNAIDLTGNKNYLLKFLDGVSFNQEDGSDGVKPSATQAIYPYNNGDFQLYVYGQDEWNKQLSNGTSTRTRWLWRFVSSHNGTLLTGDNIDPYHVVVKSNQNQTVKDKKDGVDHNYAGNTYLRTYKPDGYASIVTGTSYESSEYYADYPSKMNDGDGNIFVNGTPTEYMILGTSISNMKLMTVYPVDDGDGNTSNDVHQVVNSFEQYWKNNPTVQTIAGTQNPDENNSTLTAKNWHRYETWAYSANWGSDSKTKSLAQGNHWYQTVSMGSGEFTIEEVDLVPQVILLDQHGWEIVRVPMYVNYGSANQAVNTAALSKYNSPMVQTYQWYPTADKVTGYHKYRIPEDEIKQKIAIYENSANPDNGGKVEWHVVRRESYTSTSLAITPEDNVEGYAAQDKKYKSDFYVTYTVKSAYTNGYAGAAKENETGASPCLLKMGSNYARFNGSSVALESSGPDNLENVATNMQWYVKPNFNIDAEMGYKYANQAEKDEMESDYYNAGQNGFDPYNIRIQSVDNTQRYFTASTTGSTLTGGVWSGTSTRMTLENLNTKQTPTGYDQTTLNITNTTFMAVDDGSHHILLMPRFDNSKVLASFNDVQDYASADENSYLSIDIVPTVVHSSNDIKSMGGYYILAPDYTHVSSIGSADAPFMGTIDGQLHTLSVSHPLVAYADGAVIRNVILDNVNISSGAADVTVGNATQTAIGALVCSAKGATRVYNCGILASNSTVTTDDDGYTHISSSSSSVSGGYYVGGLVGFIDDESRVINCYSYADITGGTTVGGIVGYNAYASKAADLKTMVMNCVFYGDIKSGSTISPVYGGKNIDNLHDGLNTYNYYAYEQLKTTAISTGKYNCALGVEDVFLTRFEFYRQLLNSNRRLAAKYASKEGATVNASDMMKWVLETADRSIDAPKPYPVLKAQAKYPSIINYDTSNLPDYSEANRNKGLKTGTLAVTISESNTTAGGQTKPKDATVTTTSLTLTRTDKDFDRYNFNYDKVQLPYYNEVGTHNYTGNKVVTGWKITNVTIGSGENVAVEGSYKAGSDIGSDGKLPYNFADRKSYAKDLYGTSGRVFAQGAYFDVPYGATSITIEPYWGEAVYVSDEYFDVVFSTGYAAQNVTQLGKPFGGNEVQVSINGSSQKVYNSINNAVGALGSGGTVYDHAVVLVGNVHLSANPPNAAKSFTIMSADLDKDNEPDCSFIFGHNDRQVISPVRFDFINMPGIAMAQKPNGAGSFRNVSIFKPKGWFETTNTCIVRLVQFEYDNGGKSAAPVILQGGLIDQFVSTKTSEPKVTQYIHLGGNTWFKDFGNGTHSDGSNFTPHIPISVTGGDFDAFYLSGTYRPDATVKVDSAECYISSGRFGEVAGAAQQKIDGSIRWQIYNADIDNFYGGGVNADNPVTGNINIDIVNSHVGTFCGGPKFGDMSATKTVTTKATGCTFGTYFGAGYGGISYNRVRTKDATSYDFNSWQGDYTSSRGKYIAANKGVATDFDYEFFVWSTGKTGARFYVKYASLSMAKTNDVSSTLTNCVINKNYYGGGNLGKVDGTATSVLNGCTVEGNVFGGGYSATKPKVPIRISGFSSIPNIDTNAGVFDMGEMSGTEDYELIQGTLTNNTFAINTTDKTIVTNVELTGLGQVTTTNLTISGNTIVKGQIFDAITGEVTETTGGVFGGGDMSAVNSNTLVDVQGTEGTDGVLNVFGGGNTADVGGNTVVKVTGGKVKQDVYGGGKGQTTVVSGNVTVNIGAKTEGVLSGSATVEGSVYGGSALGAVNAKKENSTPVYSGTAGAPKTTAVNIYGGNVTGSVYGGGLGQTSPSNIAAKNFGDVTVKMEGGTVSTAVYGGSNANGVLKKDATVTITGGTVGTVANPIADAVFGGGFGEPTLVEGNVTVNIGTSGQQAAGATINGHVYGGGALGNTNASGPSTFNTESSTALNLYKGTINGDAYGGGLGQKNGVNGASCDIESFVGGNVNVLLDGAKITGSVFGCNNLNGTPKGHVKVHVKRTVDSTKNPATARDSRTTYDVAAVYGGGNKADYVPTDATLTLDAEDEEYDAGNPAKVAAACAEVVIEGCDATSIQYVYGGGNAAAVPATDVSIKGTYIIDQVFGGGNGAGEGNPGANVGIYKLNSVDTNYGSGKAVTKLYAGKIHVVYGGSNTKGNVRGGTSVSMPQKPEDGDEPEFCDDLDVKEIYGAGQNAEQDGGVTMILGCITGLENVYGGAKDANVKGGVDLVVTSGHFNKVFGGNDTSGTIQGPITVTIEETGCDSVTINELYLGGNNAAYSVYGYKQVGDNLVARTSLSDGTAVNPPASNYSDTQLYCDPVMNIISCTRIGSVFGGGYGSDATMYGSPTVNINMIPGKFAKGIDRDKDGNADNDTTAVGAIGNVYGGGNAADVVGDTRINICTEATAAVRTNIGAEIPLANRIAKAVRPAYITGDVFGAGKGTADVEKAKVTGSTTIVMTDGTVKQSVYGGGELSQVTGNTNITVSGGTIGTTGQGGEVYGNIYGGGKGNTTYVKAGLIQGNTNITMSGGTVLHNIYGGGAYGSVGTYTYANAAADAAITELTAGGTSTVTILGGTIGTDGHENGMVFGSSRGDVGAENSIHDRLAWVNDANVIIGTSGSESGPTVWGSVYGSGENGHTYNNTTVSLHSGAVGDPDNFYAYRGNVYGAGCGTDKYDSDSNGSRDAYNPMSGIVRGTATVLIDGGQVANSVYGAGAMGRVDGNTSVTITGSAVIGDNSDESTDDGNVYGAARGELGLSNSYASVNGSAVTISGGSVKNSVFGGGQAGIVKGAVTVTLSGGSISNDVYGGGALAVTNKLYDGTDDQADAYNYTTTVTLAGATVQGSVYGGGLGRLASGDDPSAEGYLAPVAANVNGPVSVTVSSGTATNVFGCNNKLGQPVVSSAVLINDGTVTSSVYGGGNEADYTGNTSVTVNGGTANDVFGGGLGETAVVTGNTNVNIAGGTVRNNVYGGGSLAQVSGDTNVSITSTGTVNNNVFGGGSLADVTNNVTVNIVGGKVVNDVYGGGALASTNTANWNTSDRSVEFVEVTGLTPTTYSVKEVEVGASVEGLYTLSQDDYISAIGIAESGVTYYERTAGTSSAGYYTRSGDEYNLVTTGTTLAGTTYYKRKVVGSWADGKNNAETGTTYKTAIILTGGLTGNVYGGGLGSTTTLANVYGDVTVSINKPSDLTATGGSGAAFTHRTQSVRFGEGDKAKDYVLSTTGRVFGCNNINGTPTGNVKVEVYSTRQTNEEGAVIAGHSPNSTNITFEIQAVYGGGNLSDYLPADGKKTEVYIGECDVTSIEKVYGGGNSASVPSTDVTINGSYEIGYAFGGGNGGDLINKDGVWYENEGAIVIGLATIRPVGGKIGQVFGGSDAKGNCGSVNIDKSESNSECPLRLTRLYGAGNEADVDKVDIVISSCSEGNDEIEYVYGGSYNAHVAGNVTLTITAGIFKNVYGGNDRTGSIGGNITVNIEETEHCKPIKIQNLLGGGNEAPYPGTRRDSTEITTPGTITVNVKSATRIDNIYGGSFKADVNGSTVVNINMTKGSFAGKPFSGESIPDSVGVIGNIFGGGNQGVVRGNTTINIGTETAVGYVTEPKHLRAEPSTPLTKNAETNLYDVPVVGAKITGNIYGGGNEANVNGNTYVNICAKYDADEEKYVPVAEGAEGVTIAGNVFGGGKGLDDTFTCEKGMVGVENANDGSPYTDKGTSIVIGNGTVNGSVYGGGEVGRVEFDTKVVVGIGNGTSGAAETPIVEGDVFGGGKGVGTHGYSGLVRGMSSVTVAGNAWVKRSVYGAGRMSSLGRYNIATTQELAEENNVEIGMPYSLKSGGTSTVAIEGYAEIGPDDMQMPTSTGHVFGAGKGFLPYEEGTPGRYYMKDGVYTWEGYNESTEDAYIKYTETLGITANTEVTIGGHAFVKGSVYGGSENGYVLSNTHVTISGDCQIGNGWNPTLNGGEGGGVNERYTTWPAGVVPDETYLYECNSWPYGIDTDDDGNKDLFAPYDKFADEDGNYPANDHPTDRPNADNGRPSGSDGHTFYGNVFGGGSGVVPYKPGRWHRQAGAVGGNTRVDIIGGHILTSVYGGNEHTDVGRYTTDSHGWLTVPVSGGECKVNMTGGTLGVPRTEAQIAEHPVTCYLFGAGKGDQRIFFNTWTNVNSTIVNVTGTARIYGSVFGGGEDGHIMNNSQVNIGGSVIIGTRGESYVDGNIFGGGRGFSGEALTAGSTGGNVTVDIKAGQMLGSVYGGGRLASVGTGFLTPDNPSYGQLIDDTAEKEYGHITVTISGGTIGTTTETGTAHSVGGNVFGGSMGRLDLLDGKRNPIWPKQAAAKLTHVTISGDAVIKNSVYGGSEYGVVRNSATVDIEGGTVHGNVFGGGYGSSDTNATTIAVGGYDGLYYTFTPMLWAGCVSGNTFVNIKAGIVKKNVYGGGELASVGLINFISDKDGNFTNIIKHESLTNGFGLSWPYKFTYHAAAPADLPAIGGGKVNGKATVTVTGGHIGSTTYDDGTGYVFGGSKGKVQFDGVTTIAEQRYVEAFCANVLKTEVTVDYGYTPDGKNGTNIGAEDNCIMGAVYGGGEDGHVYENASVEINNGLIGLSVYGGGKGINTYKAKLKDQSTGALKAEEEDIFSWTAGKVYGNTSVTMNGGHVINNVYGGGYNASVGKGNYSGGADDYHSVGYGETLTGNLWDNDNEDSKAFLSSGNTTVTIIGGTVGTLNGTYGSVGGNDSMATPTGMVFGGSRGRAAEDVLADPRYEYAPDFYLGYVNHATVTIGTRDAATGPRIYSQVFGGGRDGHVRNSTQVTINSGTIGQTYAETTAAAGHDANYHRYHRGNVYGSGSGLGLYDGTHHGMSSGSVTCNTTVDIYGGKIYNNVYGGGALSSVGPPKITEDDYAARATSNCTVNIRGGIIGDADDYEDHGYGGCVFGASRGGDFGDGESPDRFATVLWTEVNIMGGNIVGNVYGGAEGGRVKKDTEVNLTGGIIKHDAYGGGKGTATIGADVGGNATVELNKGKTADDSGCIVQRVFGCNDLNGTPRGHVNVHVYATQHEGTTKIVPAGGKTAKFKKLNDYTTSNYTAETNADDLKKLATTVGMTASEITAHETAISSGADETAKNAAIANYIDAIAVKKYDVLAVYGGGNLAPYEPYGLDKTGTAADLKATKEFAEVVIEGCDLTSIKTVYGSGNAASAPATRVAIVSAYEIDEVFGGGNGKDDYELDGTWYKNPGANVGYYNYTHYVEDGGDATTYGSGTKADPYKAIDNTNSTGKNDRVENYSYGAGTTDLEVYGGRIHKAYGGSNEKGNIREELHSQYQDGKECPMVIDESTGGSKNAEVDGAINSVMDCVKNVSTIFGGSTNADVHSDIVLNITNGDFERVFGGNNTSGAIDGSITINIQESGCQPIRIKELYGGGYLAPYSIYGYKKNASGSYMLDANGKLIPLKKGETGALATPRTDPRINIIAATEIGTIYGGGYKADVVGSPYININMTNGLIPKTSTDVTVEGNMGTEASNKTFTIEDTTDDDNWILAVGTIGNVYGGGNEADVIGDTHVEIGTGKHHNDDGEEVALDPMRNAAIITGNVYGGGRMGSVGDFTFNAAGKPVSCAEGTGVAHITMSHGELGPDDMDMNKAGGPDDLGYIFGGGKGTVDLLYDDDSKTDEEKQAAIKVMTEAVKEEKIAKLDNMAYVNNTEVVVDGDAFIKGSVYGGSENGHVLGDTHVVIDGDCQIGNGWDPSTGSGVNARYDIADFINPATASPADIEAKAARMHECSHWPYGKDTDGDEKKDLFAPHDMFASTEGKYPDGTPVSGRPQASDGHTFYGNVFGGGSGYYPYAPGQWLMKAGWVEGNTLVEVKGGHILSNIYGGNELTNVGDDVTSTTKGKCTVRMTGGTLGVPRTLDQIAEHPLTCYLFGAGKGDQAVAFNTDTNVREVEVEVSGDAIIYGSVFGGGEDGHVLGDVSIVIKDTKVTTGEGNEAVTTTLSPTIGTWGTSYVDGNVFGGGRGFGGEALTAGVVCGNVDMKISGGTMLGSIYGGGRLGSVGTHLVADTHVGMYGEMIPDGKRERIDEEADVDAAGITHGHITIDISGGNIGNDIEYKYNPTTAEKAYMPSTVFDASNQLRHTKGGNVFTGSMGRRTALNGNVLSNWRKLGNAKSTKLTIRQGVDTSPTVIKGNVYGGGEFGDVTGSHTVTFDDEDSDNDISVGTEINISGGTIGSKIIDPNDATKFYTFGSVYGGGMGEFGTGGMGALGHGGGNVMTNTIVNINGGKIMKNVYGGGELGSVGTITNAADTATVDKHADIRIENGAEVVYGFGLSWPYRFVYEQNTGKTTLNITGGRIGTDGYNDGYVFGGGKGQSSERYLEAHFANVRETEINIDYPSTPDSATVHNLVRYYPDNDYETDIPDGTLECIAGPVFGGGEDGHVYEDTHINIHSGLMAQSIYGGGRGKGTYSSRLRAINDVMDGETVVLAKGAFYPTDVFSWTAGKVYGNTNVNMTGGYVVRNVYGGGNLGSVGKGNYAGGTNDYYKAGYGETLESELWNEGTEGENDYIAGNADFLGSGKSTVTIEAGTIGTVMGYEVLLPTGNVFGSSRGQAAADVGNLSPRYEYAPDFYLGYTNETEVSIGEVNNVAKAPRIYGSVYGGGRDGHVRRHTSVTVNNGEIGRYIETDKIGDGATASVREAYTKLYNESGNVFGAGSGMGTFTDANDNDYYGTSSGSVTRNTKVVINGGMIHQNVYGGGALSCVGPPQIPPTVPIAPIDWSLCDVTVQGGVIGTGYGVSHSYGGNVFGAGRGNPELGLDENSYATSLWTRVSILSGANILGNVFGGGDSGVVKGDTDVRIGN